MMQSSQELKEILSPVVCVNPSNQGWIFSTLVTNNKKYTALDQVQASANCPQSNGNDDINKR